MKIHNGWVVNIRKTQLSQQSGLLGLDAPFCPSYQQPNRGPLLPNIPTLIPKPTTLNGLVQHAANHYHIDVSLVCAIIKQESGWNPNAVSPAGAIGLMQIMPGTGKGACGLTENQLYDPAKNIDCGVYYFSQQLTRFGSVELALCAYNAGPYRIVNGECPSFQETTDYKQRVLSRWRSGQSCPQKVLPIPIVKPIPNVNQAYLSAKGIADASFVFGIYQQKDWWTLLCDAIDEVYDREIGMVDRLTILEATVNEIYQDEMRLKGKKGWSKSKIRRRIKKVCSNRQKIF